VNININQIKPNPDNPRVLKDNKYKQLKKSIQDFPEMLSIREIIIDENNMILGGNMRYRILKELGIKDVPIKKVTNLTPEQKKEFIIKDNLPYGEWDFDLLLNEWDVPLLEEWGLDITNKMPDTLDSDYNYEDAYQIKIASLTLKTAQEIENHLKPFLETNNIKSEIIISKY
jgi:ParB-like chromosome segregation protein Spo0J